MLGTSITAGNFHARADRWVELLRGLLKHAYSPNVTVHNYGWPGVSAGFMSGCLDRLMPKQADLYIVEYAGTESGAERVAQARGHIERVLLQLRQRSRPSALLVLAPLSPPCTRRLVRRGTRRGSRISVDEPLRARVSSCSSEDSLGGALQSLAAEYGAMSVGGIDTLRSLGLLTSAWLDAPASAAQDANLTAALRTVLDRDLLHPTARGNLALARAVARAVAERVRSAEAALPRLAAGAHATGSSCSPGPPRAGRGGRSHAVCAVGPDMQALLAARRGWEYVVEVSRRGQPKPGYVSVAPGSTLDLCARPPSVPPARPPGAGRGGLAAPSAWQFGYLRSYSGMGVARGTCAGACTCAPRDFDAHQPAERSSVTVVSKLMVSFRAAAGEAVGPAATAEPASCSCTVRLTVLNRTRSGGHRFKVTAVFSGFKAFLSSNYFTHMQNINGEFLARDGPLATRRVGMGTEVRRGGSRSRSRTQEKRYRTRDV